MRRSNGEEQGRNHMEKGGNDEQAIPMTMAMISTKTGDINYDNTGIKRWMGSGAEPGCSAPCF